MAGRDAFAFVRRVIGLEPSWDVVVTTPSKGRISIRPSHFGTVIANCNDPNRILANPQIKILPNQSFTTALQLARPMRHQNVK